MSERSVTLQVVRGLGFSLVLVIGAAMAAWLVGIPAFNEGEWGPHWAAISIVGLVVFVGWVWIRVVHPGKRWIWAEIAAVAIASIPAVVPFQGPTLFFGAFTCVAAEVGWQPIRPRPSHSDIAEYRRVLLAPMPSPGALRDVSQRQAYTRERSSPAYRRVDAYVFWQAGRGSCVAGSRTRLLVSAAALVVGGGAVAGASLWATRRASRPRPRAGAA